MLNVFIAEIETAAERLKKDLVMNLHAEYIANHSKDEKTPTETKDLAAKMVNLFLAEELQYNLNKQINQSKHER